MLGGLTLDPLYKAIGYVLAFFYSLPPHNLGVAIILMTIVVMLVQFPFIAKQTRSMILMQRVQPEIKKIQQKYKDDRQKQNEELLKFYQENKINPLAGCLPMLFVLPIGMAVFRSFRQGASFVKVKGHVKLDPKTGKEVVANAGRGLQGHIPRSGSLGRLYADLCGSRETPVVDCARALKHTSPHVFYFASVNLNWSASEVASKLSGHFVQWLPYYVLIALVILTGWYQAAQTQARQARQGNAPPNPQMQTMTRVLPVVFGFITFTLNAATTLYFVVSSAWRIGQQHFVLNKMYEEEELLGGGTKRNPPPEPSPPSKRPAARDVNEQPDVGRASPTSRKGPSAGGTPRSGPSPNAARRKKKRKR